MAKSALLPFGVVAVEPGYQNYTLQMLNDAWGMLNLISMQIFFPGLMYATFITLWTLWAMPN